MRINSSSSWNLANSLRAIAAGWGFQLNTDATGNICQQRVDLIEFGVISIMYQNYVLCLSLVPKGTKREKVYQLTWDDLRPATILLCSVEQCQDADFQICCKLSALMSKKYVAEYLRCPVYRKSLIPVHTAMCDHFKGWGNFPINALGIHANVCKQHARDVIEPHVLSPKTN
jgi:hypothetical protein